MRRNPSRHSAEAAAAALHAQKRQGLQALPLCAMKEVFLTMPEKTDVPEFSDIITKTEMFKLECR
jgi:hypothetical protein